MGGLPVDDLVDLLADEAVLGEDGGAGGATSEDGGGPVISDVVDERTYRLGSR